MGNSFARLGFAGLLVLTFFAAGAKASDDFAGKFEGADFSMTVVAAEGGYAGIIRLGDQQFPLRAHAESGKLVGSFTSQGTDFRFSALLDGSALILTTGSKTHALKRRTINPLTQAIAAADAPFGYSVVHATAFGKTLTTTKPDAKTVQAALEATFPELARFFGERPTLRGAYEDSVNHVGGASFTAKLNGQSIKGFVSCKMGEQGASLAVIYCQADAGKAEWDKLTTAVADVPALKPPEVKIQLKEYQFADGTGSVGLADGWTTQAQSCMNGVQITGPGDQMVSLGLCFSAVTPDSTAVQMHRQMVMQARQFNAQVPPFEMLVAPITGPAEALKNLLPQLSALSQRHGGPGLRLDKIVKQEPTKAMLPGGHAALVTFDTTRILDGVAKQFRTTAQMEVDPISNESFMLYTTEGAAPLETFDKDLPTMVAIATSWKTNDRVVQAKTAQNIDAQHQQFAAQQKAHQAQVDAFDRYNKAWEERGLANSRNNADFDEVIRGYRTVEDTRTGYQSSVDLGNVHEIVNKLNEGDAGRYKEIPLRDEMYPVR